MASRAAKIRRTAASNPDRSENRRPTIHDVARLARVGIGTVSRVINNNPSVRPDIRQAVVNAVAQLGYEPDVLARGMRRPLTRAVGCIFRSISLPTMTAFLGGASSVFNQAGCTMVLGLAQNNAAAVAHLRSFGERRMDGVLLAVDEEPDLEILNTIRQFRLKTLFLNREVAGEQPAVSLDFRSSVVEAFRCVVGFGHRRIALLGMEDHRSVTNLLVTGFNDAHQAAGLRCREDLIRLVEPTLPSGMRATGALLAGKKPPTAILVSGDMLLAGAVRAIQSAGLAVGRDVSLVALGDSDLAHLMSPSVTAIRWDICQLGRLTAQMLMDSLETAVLAPPQRLLIPPELVLRQSCQSPP